MVFSFLGKTSVVYWKDWRFSVFRHVVKQLEEKQSRELMLQAVDLLNNINWPHAAQ